MAHKSVAVHREDETISHYTTPSEAHKMVAESNGTRIWGEDFKAVHRVRGEGYPWKVKQSGHAGPLVLQMVTR